MLVLATPHMTSPPPSSHPIRVSVLLAAWVIALAWAGNATAGCGDHVVILKPAGVGTTDDTPAPKAPCHGPHCSAEPANPLPVPTTSGIVPTPSAKEQFTPVDVSPPADDRSPAHRFEFTSPRPIHRASSIFHPPRV